MPLEGGLECLEREDRERKEKAGRTTLGALIKREVFRVSKEKTSKGGEGAEARIFEDSRGEESGRGGGRRTEIFREKGNVFLGGGGN